MSLNDLKSSDSREDIQKKIASMVIDSLGPVSDSEIFPSEDTEVKGNDTIDRAMLKLAATIKERGVAPSGGGGGEGAVDSVNGQTGEVVLDAEDVGAAPTSHTHTWDQVTNKPSTFPPSAHEHNIEDVIGLPSSLDGKAATSHTHSAAQVTSGTFADARIPNLNANKINAGIFNEARIPTLPKSRVGLGNVENYGIASQGEAEAGESNDAYMTPELTAAAIAAQVPVRHRVSYTDSESDVDGSNFTVGYLGGSRMGIRSDFAVGGDNFSGFSFAYDMYELSFTASSYDPGSGNNVTIQLANNSNVVHLSGNETVAGQKTFTTPPSTTVNPSNDNHLVRFRFLRDHFSFCDVGAGNYLTGNPSLTQGARIFTFNTTAILPDTQATTVDITTNLFVNSNRYSVFSGRVVARCRVGTTLHIAVYEVAWEVTGTTSFNPVLLEVSKTVGFPLVTAVDHLTDSNYLGVQFTNNSGSTVNRVSLSMEAHVKSGTI